MGHSAGAHLAAMVALDGRYLAAQGLAPGAVAGLIGIAGAYDFLPLTSETLKLTFPEETRASSQPIAFVTSRAPPALLAAGKNDATVRVGNMRRLAARMREQGVPVTEVIYPDAGHVAILARLAAPLRANQPLLDEIERFVLAR